MRLETPVTLSSKDLLGPQGHSCHPPAGPSCSTSEAGSGEACPPGVTLQRYLSRGHGASGRPHQAQAEVTIGCGCSRHSLGRWVTGVTAGLGAAGSVENVAGWVQGGQSRGSQE